jgi:hypothetical protein
MHKAKGVVSQFLSSLQICRTNEEQRVASSPWVQCCVMQCMCARANKGKGRQIIGRADTPCKRGTRERRATGMGLPRKAGTRAEEKDPLPRETW